MRHLALLALLLLVAPSSSSSVSALRFARIFGSNMVLQRAPEQAAVWGYTEPGTAVQVSLSQPDGSWLPIKAAVFRSFVDPNETVWKTLLPPTPAGGPYSINLQNSQGGNLTLDNVLFGDVFLCSGQSNMDMTVMQAYNGTQQLLDAPKYSHIRLFTVGHIEADKSPNEDLASAAELWSIPSTESLNGTEAWSYFSATCWFFGRSLSDELAKANIQVPLGLIVSSYGGTVIEAWSTPDSLASCGPPNPPPAKKGPNAHLLSLFNGQIFPLLNTTIKGAVWYQGESNVLNPKEYTCLFPAMIRGWRDLFSRVPGTTSPTFPFGFVQLAGYCACTQPKSECDNSKLAPTPVADLRWAQTAGFGDVPNPQMQRVFMAPAYDLADPDSPLCDIHPRSKFEIGRRLARGAANMVYGLDLQFQGPYPSSAVLSSSPLGSNILYNITMSHYHVAESPIVFNKAATLAAAYEVVFPSTGEIRPAVVSFVNATHIVASTLAPPMQGIPAAIRYAWRDRPCSPLYNADGWNCQIYNSLGLPLPPFAMPLS